MILVALDYKLLPRNHDLCIVLGRVFVIGVCVCHHSTPTLFDIIVARGV